MKIKVEGGTLHMRLSREVTSLIIQLIEEAKQLISDPSKELELVVAAGTEHPLGPDDAVRLLTGAINAIKTSASGRRDTKMLRSLDTDVESLVRSMVEMRSAIMSSGGRSSNLSSTLVLQPRNGIKVKAISPVPVFHGKEIPMYGGFVSVMDIKLWDQNERLDIHLAQFRQVHGREPSSEELLDIMMGNTVMPGTTDSDEFSIRELARSIANNGVRKPPILDVDGTLLDGNRRVTACYHILSSKEFTPEQKQRCQYIYVWQLTEHATEDDRRRVVVSLNFEPDFKKEWPTYVKARKIYEDWQGILALYPSASHVQQAELKRELSQRYALGPDTSQVNRFIKMVQWANEFEEFHTIERGRDEFQVKHAASKHFEYFDEIGKGANPGGVAWCLGQDDAFKKLVFDLLLEGKFLNWKQIRDLRYAYGNDESRDLLKKARADADVDHAQETVKEALAWAHATRPEARQLGANQRIEVFVKFLTELPIKAFKDQSVITRQNLIRLYEALKLVEPHVKEVVENGE